MKIKLIFISIFFTLNLCSCQNENSTSKMGIDYYELGLPNMEKEWTGSDLQKSFDVLNGLKKSNTLSLPRLEDKETSAIFKKVMNSLPKVNPLDTLNLMDQFENYRMFKKTLPDLFTLYWGNSESEHEYYSNETIEVLKRVLIETTKTSEIYFEYYVPDLEDSEDNRKKAKSFNEGSFKIFLGILNMNEPKYKYHLADKLELAETISTNLNKIWGNLNQEYSSELLEKVVYFSKESEFPEVRKVFSELAVELNGRK